MARALVDQAGQTMGEVVSSIRRVTDIMVENLRHRPGHHLDTVLAQPGREFVLQAIGRQP